MIGPRVLSLIAAVSAASAMAQDLEITNAPIPTSDLDKRSVLTSQFGIKDGEKFE